MCPPPEGGYLVHAPYPLGGWIKPYGSEVWHYFEEGSETLALCRASFYAVSRLGVLPDYIGDPQPDDCPECRRVLEGRSSRGNDDQLASTGPVHRM